jgi:sodium-dependent dicarboxylate transporter 2/3/5
MSRVLLIDDEDRFRTALANRLRTRGFDVTDVDNGEEAVKWAHTDNGIDVAVIDLPPQAARGERSLAILRRLRELDDERS